MPAMSYPTVRHHDIALKRPYMIHWERLKHTKVHLLAEMFAEMGGVFFYVYAGVGATAAMIVGDLTSETAGSSFAVGFAYSIGIVLAIAVCATASGGHFNPGVTVSLVIHRGFPKGKAVLYILAQILGGFLACLFVYAQWKDFIVVAENALHGKRIYDEYMFTPRGPGGIFALYVMPGTNLHRVLLNEFVTDVLIGISIAASLDPCNHFIPPAAAPWVIGFTYGIAIWGFSPTALAANTARDVGARMMAMTIWGRKAAGGQYAAIAALTNIPATVLAFFIYDTLLSSSCQTLTPPHVAYLGARKVFYEEHGLAPPGYLSALGPYYDLKSYDGRRNEDMETMEVISKVV